MEGIQKNYHWFGISLSWGYKIDLTILAYLYFLPFFYSFGFNSFRHEGEWGGPFSVTLKICKINPRKRDQNHTGRCLPLWSGHSLVHTSMGFSPVCSIWNPAFYISTEPVICTTCKTGPSGMALSSLPTLILHLSYNVRLFLLFIPCTGGKS